jgi:hypothetical protein
MELKGHARGTAVPTTGQPRRIRYMELKEGLPIPLLAQTHLNILRIRYMELKVKVRRVLENHQDMRWESVTWS